MTDELLHCREQWPVGQGFFHCGHVRAVTRGEDSWRWRDAMRIGDLFYVYDCGAMSATHFERANPISSFFRPNFARFSAK
jgi:hypothetical protein